jgi:nucleoside-diphosphate-sugar epimerase
MNVFILGCTGFIGSAVAARLAAAGHTVTGLAHNETAGATLEGRGYGIVRGQLGDGDVLAAAATGADAVVWAVNPDPSIAGTLPDVIGGLLGALSGSDKPFAYAGGAALYSDTGEGAADESWPLLDMPMVSLFVQLERMVVDSAAQGVRSIALRQAIAYGHGGSASVLGLIGHARQTGAAPYVGSGEVKISTVHVDDLAGLYEQALSSAPPGTVLNAAADPPVTGRELAEAVAVAAGVDATTSVDPAQAMQLLGPAGFILAKSAHISAAKAEQLLGWQPSGPSLIEELTSGSYRS